MAPHGTGNGLLGLAALVQVCATLPDNYIAFEYPVGKPDWWYDIVDGLPDPIVQDGLIEVWDRPGMGVEFNIEARAGLPARGGSRLLRLRLASVHDSDPLVPGWHEFCDMRAMVQRPSEPAPRTPHLVPAARTRAPLPARSLAGPHPADGPRTTPPRFPTPFSHTATGTYQWPCALVCYDDRSAIRSSCNVTPSRSTQKTDYPALDCCTKPGRSS